MTGVENTALATRLLDGLDRFAAALRADVRRSTAPRGLNPTQNAILRLLLRRPAGLRVNVLAEHLGVRQPTVTDSVIALERKGLARRQADLDDARAVIVKAAPNAEPPVMEAAPPALAAATLSDLSEPEQVGLLRMLIKLIRGLQLRQAIPAQRLCVTCKYFRPNVHPHADAPHHCAFLDAPFGDRALRLDCAEHEEAQPQEQARNWNIFESGRPQLEIQP